MGLKFLNRHLRQLTGLVDVQAGVQLHQVFIPRFGLRQQNHRRRQTRLAARIGGQIGHIDLTSQNRLDARARKRHGKLQRCEHVVGIGQRHGRHLCRAAKFGQLLQPHRSFQQRILGMDAKMNESGTAHAPDVRQMARGGKAPSKALDQGFSKTLGTPNNPHAFIGKF